MASSFAYLMINNGANNASVYPYIENKASCRFNSNFSRVELSSFVTLPSGDEETLKNALASVGPISVRINAINLIKPFSFNYILISLHSMLRKTRSTATVAEFMMIQVVPKS